MEGKVFLFHKFWRVGVIAVFLVAKPATHQSVHCICKTIHIFISYDNRDDKRKEIEVTMVESNNFAALESRVSLV